MKRRPGRPGRLWLLFWGRKRRGFPGLLAAVVLVVLLGAATSRLPRGYDVGFWLGIALLVTLAGVTAAALGAALYLSLRPRRRR